VIVKPKVPAFLFDCGPMPGRPHPPITEAKLGEFILNLGIWGEGCRDNLAVVKGLVEWN
jgi:hypothetical protein